MRFQRCEGISQYLYFTKDPKIPLLRLPEFGTLGTAPRGIPPESQPRTTVTQVGPSLAPKDSQVVVGGAAGGDRRTSVNSAHQFLHVRRTSLRNLCPQRHAMQVIPAVSVVSVTTSVQREQSYVAGWHNHIFFVRRESCFFDGLTTRRECPPSASTTAAVAVRLEATAVGMWPAFTHVVCKVREIDDTTTHEVTNRPCRRQAYRFIEIADRAGTVGACRQKRGAAES